MRAQTFALALLGAVLLALGLAPLATAQTDVAEKTTYFTFNRTVALPGNVTLPPGKYRFRLADSTTGRRVVQVLDEQGKVYALLLSLMAVKPEPSEQAQVRFMEVPQGQPPAIKTWWYRAETYGYEFVYSKQEATRLTTLTKTSLPMMETPVATAKAETAVEAARALETAPVTRTEVAGEPAVNIPAITFAATPGPAPEAVVAALPKTASPLMFIGLMGALSLFAAGGLRLFR